MGLLMLLSRYVFNLKFIHTCCSSLEFEFGRLCLFLHQGRHGPIGLSSSVKLNRTSISQPLRFVPLSDLFLLTYRTRFYSANPAMVFSGIACTTDVRFSFPIFLLFPYPHHTDDAPDLEALGGQWHTGLTRDVTCLFALGPGSDKYETTMRFQANTYMKAVLPSALV